MRSRKLVQIVGCHAEGEVGDVIVGGVAPPPGDTVWAQSRWIARDEELRNFVLREPRGGVFRHVNLLVPPTHPDADVGFIVMEPNDTPPMSGSNAICVTTVLLETGRLPMTEPETVVTLEAPGGLIQARAACRDGRVERVEIRNHPSFVDRRDAEIDAPGFGRLRVDTAYGGDSFVLVEADDLGLELAPANARALVEAGVRITAAANAQLGFRHPENDEWRHISFCQITGPVRAEGDALAGTSAVAIRPGKLDRSPCGTGCSARMALLRAQGVLKVGRPYRGRSLLGSEFQCRIVGETQVGEKPAIAPSVAGRAWITGMRTEMLDPDDPWPDGYALSDTWPQLV